MIDVKPPGKRNFVERRRQTEILKLIGRAEVIQRTGNDPAEWSVSIAFLCERGPSVVCIAGILRIERNEGSES